MVAARFHARRPDRPGWLHVRSLRLRPKGVSTVEIIGVGLILVVLAAAFVVLLRGSTRGVRRSETASESGAGEGPGTDLAPDPTVDRPAGPAAETHMGPGPGVFHPDSQHDADASAPDETPGPPPDGPPNRPNTEP